MIVDWYCVATSIGTLIVWIIMEASHDDCRLTTTRLLFQKIINRRVSFIAERSGAGGDKEEYAE